MGASSGHHLIYLHRRVGIVWNEQNNYNFSELKQIYWSMATAITSNIQLFLRHFSSEKCVDPLNAANIFYVHAFLHGICK